MNELSDSDWRHMRRTLFRSYPQDVLRDWALSLRHFRVVLDHGGMLGGGDRLLLQLKVHHGKGQFERIFKALGASLPLESSAPAEPADMHAAGTQSPTGANLPKESRYVEPEVLKTFLVRGVEVQSYRSAMRLELWIADREKPFDVSQTAVDEARSIEHLFDSLADILIDPPQDSPHCVCPRYYPSLWSEGTWRANPTSSRSKRTGRGKRRPQPAFLMACLGIALLILGAKAWVPPGDTVAANPVFAYFHEAGGSLLASGVFVLPGLLLLGLSWRIVRIRRRR